MDINSNNSDYIRYTQSLYFEYSQAYVINHALSKLLLFISIAAIEAELN